MVCGIFGAVGPELSEKELTIRKLAKHAGRRGNDSSGIVMLSAERFDIIRANKPVKSVLEKTNLAEISCAVGHARLATNGEADNQPVFRNEIVTFHNGIVLNEAENWDFLNSAPTLQIDTEIMPALLSHFLSEGMTEVDATSAMLTKCQGSISAVFLFPRRGKMVLCSNTGSLFFGFQGQHFLFASEKHALEQVKCTQIVQVNSPVEFVVACNKSVPQISDSREARRPLLPALSKSHSEEKHLAIPDYDLLRCSKCILPETMPFIGFNENGVCNYCENYIPKLSGNRQVLLEQTLRGDPGQNPNGPIIFPFSGGRDSSFGLHYLVDKLKVKPVTYTYDWGMLTDLGRRNISLMCSKLGVENIVVAANIAQKRENIRKNLSAWLKQPHLGMVNLLTAGDKHFFQHIRTLKKELGATLSVWSFNPLETTHFKTGFLGVPPGFSEAKVYKTGIASQVQYHRKRLSVMVRNPSYLNGSLWDTLSGEYYRSVARQTDSVQLFDYIPWEESEVNKTLSNFGWETAADTQTTWRIGDGTAAFYNYVFYVMAGFTEHDTFRSNQVREGQLTRTEALTLVRKENLPRYPNIRWYLDAVGFDFKSTIDKIKAHSLT